MLATILPLRDDDCLVAKEIEGSDLKILKCASNFMFQMFELNKHRFTVSVSDVWQGFRVKEVTLAGPWNEDMNIGY